MTNNEIKEIYKTIDNRLRKHKTEWVAFAREKKYTFFSEYIHTEYKTRTGADIIAEMERAGLVPVKHSYLWTIKNRVKELMEDNVPLIPEDKLCYMCKKRKVAKGNFALCKVCDKSKNGLTYDSTYGEPNNCHYA